MTSRWRKGILKESDIEINIPVGMHVWGHDQHKPLLMFISFPLCRHPPWSLRGTNYLEGFCWELRGLWEDEPERSRDFRRQLLERMVDLQSLSQGVVRSMLSS